MAPPSRSRHPAMCPRDLMGPPITGMRASREMSSPHSSLSRRRGPAMRIMVTAARPKQALRRRGGKCVCESREKRRGRGEKGW